MPDKWLSIAAAAATMNVHPRTIERRIASNKIESRRADDGQVQVLVNVQNEPTAPLSDPLETVRELAQDQMSLVTGSASAIVRLAQVDADRARDELMLVREQADRLRKGGRTAWSMVGVMAIGSMLAIGWTTHRITSADASISEMQKQANQTERAAERLMVERDAARQEAERAKLASAETVGRLSAYVEQAQLEKMRPVVQIATVTPTQTNATVPDKRPTTRPTTVPTTRPTNTPSTLIQRISAGIFPK